MFTLLIPSPLQLQIVGAQLGVFAPLLPQNEVSINLPHYEVSNLPQYEVYKIAPPQSEVFETVLPQLEVFHIAPVNCLIE